MKFNVFLCSAMIAWLGGSMAESADNELPAAAREVLKQFEDESNVIEKTALAAVTKLREQTAVELKKVQDALCKEAKLDEAVAVRDLIRDLTAGTDTVFCKDLPAAAREVYQLHEKDEVEALKKIEEEVQKLRDRTAAEFKKQQDLFCKELKLDEAVAIRNLARAVQEGVPHTLPDPGYVNNAAEDIGKVLYYDTRGVTTGQSIYGTDIFTTGSHLGMAAVHSGVLKAGQRGVVKVTILPGQQHYSASTKHGVTSYEYGAYHVSFKVERAYAVLGRLFANVIQDPGSLTGYRGQVGKVLLIEVTGQVNGSVYGTDIYTDDSSLSTAVVHAGILPVGKKGIVKVMVLAGQETYVSTTQNGVTSNGYGNWVGSYRVERCR